MDVVINTNYPEQLSQDTSLPPSPTGWEGEQVASPMQAYQGNFYHHLLTCLGYPKDKPPLADLLKRYAGLEGQWLVVSPIHWEATHNNAMIVATPEDLQLSEEESQRWFTALSDFVAIENMTMHYYNAQTWLIHCPGKPGIVAEPVHQVRYRSMMPLLQQLDDTMFWQRFITESQMFFSAHPLNKERTGFSINGLWIWGDGELHPPGNKPLVCGNEHLMKLGSFLSTKVSQYVSLQKLQQNDLLLLDNLSLDGLNQLQNQLRNVTVHWHWNNLVYCSKRKNLWTRMLDRFKS